jgi:hypothetical protein
MFTAYYLLHNHPYNPLLPSWRQHFEARFNFSICMNTGSGLKMESPNFLTTMHKDEAGMHFLSALVEQMVKRVLHVWPHIREVVLLCFTLPLLRATRHSSRSVRTVQAYPTLFGHCRRGMLVYQTKTSIVRLNFRLYVAK